MRSSSHIRVTLLFYTDDLQEKAKKKKSIFFFLEELKETEILVYLA